MASTYTPLGVELMATGENAGTWGTKTNANLNLFEELTGGYRVVTLNAGGTGANTTDLTVVDGALTGTAQARVIILGAESPETIAGNKIVTIPLDVENVYFIKNSTSGSHTVQLKYASGSGDTVTWTASNKGWKMISASANDGTNPDVKEIEIDTVATPGGSTTQVQFNNSGAFDGDANLTWTAGTALTIGSQKELRLADSSGGEYVGLKSAGTATSYTMTLPAAVGASGTALVTTDGSGTLGFTATSTFGITTGKAIAMAIVFG